ncbi:hypothetical protein HMPREF9319_0015 [Streptococcus equinus ATCC 700338]|uniref:Uncharacterized protein n=1 Tax=Streptococcus equinus ATCC 700338 TaxID=864569 RepID=E0PAZ2_STREI|nr:hypothetical protein HMPREF9319_0015 [Streptococcus equinus ATCC 700338]
MYKLEATNKLVNGIKQDVFGLVRKSSTELLCATFFIFKNDKVVTSCKILVLYDAICQGLKMKSLKLGIIHDRE